MSLKHWIFLINPPLLLQLVSLDFCYLLGVGKGFTEEGEMSWALKDEQEIGSG